MFPRSAAFVRSLSRSARQFKQSPLEFTLKQAAKVAEDAAFKLAMLGHLFEYKPQYIGKDEVNPVLQRPVPINVELLQYKPLRHKPVHGHKCATIALRGYTEDDLIRAGEFILRAAYYLGVPCLKLKTEKTEKRLYTVIRSPFAQAKLKENFHRVTYKREIVAYDANPEVIDLWLSYINKYALDTVEYLAAITVRQGLEWVADGELPEAYNDVDNPVAQKVKELLASAEFSESSAPEQVEQPKKEAKEPKKEPKEPKEAKDSKKETKSDKE